MKIEADKINNLIAKAKEIMKNSYSPYSRFTVGAAILSDDEKTYLGCNVENESYGLTVCAERTAILKAVSEGVRSFKMIAVYSENESPTYPCGACLQTMLEFAEDPDDFYIIASCKNGYEVFSLKEMLPKGFKL